MIKVAKINKTIIEQWSRLIGMICLFTVVINSGSTTKFSQELRFVIAIAGIIFLSITLNLKLSSKKEADLSLIKRNQPLILGCFASLFLLGWYVYSNYIF